MSIMNYENSTQVNPVGAFSQWRFLLPGGWLWMALLAKVQVSLNAGLTCGSAMIWFYVSTDHWGYPLTNEVEEETLDFLLMALSQKWWITSNHRLLGRYHQMTPLSCQGSRNTVFSLSRQGVCETESGEDFLVFVTPNSSLPSFWIDQKV